MLIKEKIKEIYDKTTCYQTEKCSKKRTQLKNGGFFPSPYSYVGETYSTPIIGSKKVPKIFCLSVNQNLLNIEDVDEDKARNSLYPTKIDSLEGHWYGPLELCVSLSNIIFSQYIDTKNVKEMSNKEIMGNIAYSNSVRCGNPNALSGKPTEEMIKNCEWFTEQEINVLQPDIILAIGKTPFKQIQKIYKNNIKHIAKDFAFEVEINNKTITVVYFYHYGQQQSINTGKKMITLFSAFSSNAKMLIKDIESEVEQYNTLWRIKKKYNVFAKYYAIKIIEQCLKAGKSLHTKRY